MFFGGNDNLDPFYESRKYLNSGKNGKKKFKDKIYEYGNNYIETRIKESDENYNKRNPYNHGDIFDKFNNYITEGLYYSDKNLGTGMLGHGIAAAGRITRSNYEQNYERSPFTDGHERAWDAFKKSTDIDY